MKSRKSNPLTAIRTSGGTFFGLRTKSGQTYNAQLVKETPLKVRIFDRNLRATKTVSKSDIQSVTSRGHLFRA